MNEFERDRRLEAIEQRLERLEQLLGRSVAPPPVPPGAKRSVSPPPLPSPAPPVPAAQVTGAAGMAEAGRATVSEQPASLPPPMSAAEAALRGDLERTIGLKWAGWIGAIVLVAGVAFGVKYAYDQGWFAHLIPPGVWLGLIFLAGGVLIAAGEAIYRRVNASAAASVFGAGVAILFLAGYVGDVHFELYSQSTAFVLMAASALVGAGVAMRGNLVSIAVLALVGANLAPILVSSPQPRLQPFLFYLLALQVVALFLADWGRGQKWWTLRGLSLAATALWMLVVLIDLDPQWLVRFGWKLAFTLIFAGLFHLEIWIALLRSTWRDDPTDAVPGAILTLLTTALAAGAIVWLFQGSRPMIPAIWFAGGAGLFATLAWIGVRRARSAPAFGQLADSYAIQSIGLVVAAFPILFNRFGTAMGWGLLAVALAALGWLRRMRIARYASVATWVLAVLVLNHLAWIEGGGVREFDLFHQPIGRNLLLAWLLALLANAIARLCIWRVDLSVPEVENGPRVQTLATVMYIAAAFVWCVASIAGLPALWATILMLAYALGLTIPQIFRSRLRELGAILAIIAALKWAGVDTFAPHVFAYRPLWNLPLGVGLLIIATLAVLRPIMARMLPPKDDPAAMDVLTGVMGALMLLVGLWAGSMEIFHFCRSVYGQARFADPDLAAQVGLSIYWALYAIACIAAGFLGHKALLRYFALGLFAVTLLKIVLIDMSSVQTGYRILSFLAMGLLLLGTSVLYGRVKAS